MSMASSNEDRHANTPKAGNIQSTVRQYMQDWDMLQPGIGPVAVALSGGADSVALLRILSALGTDIVALHCNFHLRGEESDRDERFCLDLCSRLGIRIHVRHFDTTQHARNNGISIEMAARDLRYEWFFGMMQSLGAQSIAVAHHRDDQAETLLLNLMRGCGLRGLAGIHPVRDRVIRPLLCIGREDILAYLSSIGQDFVTDSTNLERDALRNVIRLDIIPRLREINPRITESLCNTCSIVRDSLPLYLQGLSSELSKAHATADRLPLEILRHHPNSPTLLHEWLRGKSFSQAQEGEVLAACHGTAGKMWSSNTHRLLIDRDYLMLEPIDAETVIPTLRQEIVQGIGETGPHVAYFDAGLIHAPILVRRTRPGDSFVPLGMKGRKLISDFLTDRKVSRFEKERQLVATCGNDIIWLIGHRSDNRYRVTDRTTSILKLTLVR